MTIITKKLTPLTGVPSINDPQNFEAEADALLNIGLPRLVEEANEFIDELNAFQPGTAPRPAALEILDEEALLTASPSKIKFTGAGVTASAEGSVITVSVPGSALAPAPAPVSMLAIADEGTEITADAKAINFVGAGVTATAGPDGAVTVSVAGVDTANFAQRLTFNTIPVAGQQTGILFSLRVNSKQAFQFTGQLFARREAPAVVEGTSTPYSPATEFVETQHFKFEGVVLVTPVSKQPPNGQPGTRSRIAGSQFSTIGFPTANTNTVGLSSFQALLQIDDASQANSSGTMQLIVTNNSGFPLVLYGGFIELTEVK